MYPTTYKEVFISTLYNSKGLDEEQFLDVIQLESLVLYQGSPKSRQTDFKLTSEKSQFVIFEFCYFLFFPFT